MKYRNRSNVLLVEILIAVLFFMLSATVLIEVFAASRNMTVRAGVEAQALAEAQNLAEAVYASDDADAALREMGFVNSHGAWSLDCGEYSLYVELGEISMQHGRLIQGTISAYYKLRDPDAARQADEELFSLPCVKYVEVAA